MDKNSLLNLINNALKISLNMDSNAHINVNADLRDYYGLDSMSTLTLLIEVEKNVTGFFLNPEEIEASDLKTVSSLCKFVERNIGLNTCRA